MKEKKIPLRKCVITNEQHPKSELIRVVRTPEKEVVIDMWRFVKLLMGKGKARIWITKTRIH